MRFIPICEEIEKMAARKKFNSLFDIVVCGFIASTLVKNKALLDLIKNDALVYIEAPK